MIVYRYLLTGIIIILFACPAEVCSQLQTIDVDLEIITTQALAGGDGGNQWGGHQCRIFQDSYHRFFILDDNGMFYLLDAGGKSPIDSVQLDLKNHPVNYAGHGLAVPRTGSKLSNKMDVVFPSHQGKFYVYFQLKMDDIFPFP